MQLRDALAAHALAGLLSYYAQSEGVNNREIALRAYLIADEMLAAREIDPDELDLAYGQARRDG